MYGVVAGTKSKYATIAAARLLVLATYVEVFFMLLFLVLYLHAGGFAFADFSSAAAAAGSVSSTLPPLGAFLLLYALFEAKRAPFDHSEAESELVAGHLVEYGGRALLFFYLCEYAHLLACVFLVACLILGGSGGELLAGSLPYWAGQVGASWLGLW